MEYYSAIKRNAFESVVVKGMKLEPIIQNEVSKNEKNIIEKNTCTPMFLLCCSVMSDSATPWTVAHQDPLSMGFSRLEYWSG